MNLEQTYGVLQTVNFLFFVRSSMGDHPGGNQAEAEKSLINAVSALHDLLVPPIPPPAPIVLPPVVPAPAPLPQQPPAKAKILVPKEHEVPARLVRQQRIRRS